MGLKCVKDTGGRHKCVLSFLMHFVTTKHFHMLMTLPALCEMRQWFALTATC